MTQQLFQDLTTLYQNRRYQAILDQIIPLNISPSSNPQVANVVAAALFQLAKFDECLLWCEGLVPSLGSDPTFISMYGAVLRRFEKLDQAETLFRQALTIHPCDLALRNNFANLLIDRRQFDEAESILKQLVAESPDYEDAKANLNRLQFQKTLALASPSSSLSSSQGNSNTIDDLFVDPLVAAFSDDEISDSNNSLVSKSVQTAHRIAMPDRVLSNEIQEIVTLSRSILDVNPAQVLEDCRMLHARLGVNAVVYLLAADAYIRLKLFSDAESALLISFSLGSNDPSIPLNLANLAAMRGDQKLALYWLDVVAKDHPDHPQLTAVTKMLFPNGVPEKSTTPFQLNIEQASTGSFAPS